MIFGIGNDIVDIRRVEATLARRGKQGGFNGGVNNIIDQRIFREWRQIQVERQLPHHPQRTGIHQ